MHSSEIAYYGITSPVSTSLLDTVCPNVLHSDRQEGLIHTNEILHGMKLVELAPDVYEVQIYWDSTYRANIALWHSYKVGQWYLV